MIPKQCLKKRKKKETERSTALGEERVFLVSLIVGDKRTKLAKKENPLLKSTSEGKIKIKCQ